MRAVILAAGRGSRLRHLTENSPKCLTPIFGKPLIHWQKLALMTAGVERVEIVGGYEIDCLRSWSSEIYENVNWAETNMVSSLMCADKALSSSECIVSYSDIFYASSTVLDLARMDVDIAITYDPNWLNIWSKRFSNPLDDAETFKLNKDGDLIEIGKPAQTVGEIEGQYMGLLKFTVKGWKIIRSCIETFSLEQQRKLDMTSLLNELVIRGVKIRAVSNEAFWGEVDHETDIAVYEDIHSKNGCTIETVLGV